MHNSSFHRIAVLALTLGAAGLTATLASAQTNDGTDTTTPSTDSTKHWHHHHDSVLTPDERAELKKDFQDVLANNADIKAESDNLKAQEKALHEQAKVLHEKIHDAVVAADPNAQALFDKLQAAHQGQGGWHHHHHGDAPADSSTTPDTSDTTTNQ